MHLNFQSDCSFYSFKICETWNYKPVINCILHNSHLEYIEHLHNFMFKECP
jgi:hypothetical protein